MATPNAVLKASANAAGFYPVRAGTLASKTLNNQVSTNSGRAELNVLCGLIPGNRVWFDLRPEEPGVLSIDTEGSDIDTLLGIFTQQSFTSPLDSVACDEHGAPDGRRSRVRFKIVPGTHYLIGIDGRSGQTGVIQLNWILGGMPLSVRRSGAMLQLSWPASFAGFVLEQASSLGGAGRWSTAGFAIPAPVNGTITLSIPLGPAGTFYRLRQP